ncbi:DUF4129 domain-containing protein [Halobaculum sp. P14]|uniref:DUF4129 domain-containing protein n=1 Tax=Halobaculum sp. P14 TaxID=3421638 RepID=UPI003EBFE37E
MPPRTSAPLLVAALAVLALAVGASTFDAVHRLDGASAGAPNDGVRADSSSASPEQQRSQQQDAAPDDDAGADTGGDVDRTGTGGSPVLMVGFVAAGVLAAAVLLRRLAAGDGESVDRSTGDGSDDDAGRRADRADPTPENPVTAAWLTLARRVAGADWRRRTPGEIAAAARDDGLPAASVAELRGLFERVRYGGAPVTPEREARAEAAVDRLDAGGENAQ